MAKKDYRIPVISDPHELNIPWRTLQTIIAGRSLIDTFELNVSDHAEADKFLKSYGLQNNTVAEELLIVAVEYVETVLHQGCRYTAAREYKTTEFSGAFISCIK